MRRVKDRIYYLGVVITFLSLAGLAESFTGHGSAEGAIIFFIIGFAMVLQGYIK